MESKLSVDAVYDAFKTLLGNGQYPSRNKIRHELATTASEQTLQKLMGEVYTRVAAEMGGELPAGLPRYAVQATQRLYDDIRGDAQKEIDQARSQAEDEVRQAVEQRDSIKIEQEALEKQIDYMQERLDQTDKAHRQCLEERDTARQESSEYQASLNRLIETHETHRRDTAKNMRSLRATQRTAIKTAADRELALKEALATTQQRAESDREQMMRELDQARQALNEAKEAAQRRAKASENKRAEQSQHISTLQEEITQLKIQLSNQNHAITQLRAQVESGDIERQQIIDRRDHAIQQAKAAEQQVAHLEQQIQDITGKLRVAEVRVEEKESAMALLRKGLEDTK